MAEEGIGKAADQRLFGAVNDKNNIGKPGQCGIPALGKGHDLVTVLLGMTHIVKHRLGSPLWLTANITEGSLPPGR